MGIKGLLPLLDPIATDVHIQAYAGRKVAVDGHCWLHRGAFGCAFELAMDGDTDKYVSYFIHMVQMLIFYKVTPIIVFDGQPLPMKEVTTRQRALDRARHLSEGRKFAAQGDKEKANKSFQQAISITDKMVYAVIKALDKIKVEYVIAPYEADPQLTYMINVGHADAVITEDSDLLTFGCRKVIYKLSRYGEGRQIQYDDIFTSEKLRMTRFTPDMFRYMCITSGCDYLPSLCDIGLKKAQGLVERHPTLDKLLYTFTVFRPKHIVEPYVDQFVKANAAFLYQFVFDMNSRTYFRLNPLPKDMDARDVSLLGTNPQDRYIPLLRANKAIILPKLDYKEVNKENINPLAFDDDEDFDEIKFDDTTLKQVEDLLQKVEEPRSSTSLRDRTNNPTGMKNNVTQVASKTKPSFAVFIDPVVEKQRELAAVAKKSNVAKASISIRPAFGDKTNASTRLASQGDKAALTRPAFGDKTNASARLGDKTNISTRPAFGDKTNTSSARPAFGDKTNTLTRPALTGKTNRAKTISLSKTNKRKSLLVYSDAQDSPTTITKADLTKKQKVVSDTTISDRELSNLVFAAMMGDKKAMEQRQDMLLKEYKASIAAAAAATTIV